MFSLVDVTYKESEFAEPKPNGSCGTCLPSGDGCNPADNRKEDM